jgi:hypothetical protein
MCTHKTYRQYTEMNAEKGRVTKKEKKNIQSSKVRCSDGLCKNVSKDISFSRRDSGREFHDDGPITSHAPFPYVVDADPNMSVTAFD